MYNITQSDIDKLESKIISCEAQLAKGVELQKEMDRKGVQGTMGYANYLLSAEITKAKIMLARAKRQLSRQTQSYGLYC